jgi:hypothetical protein
MRLICNESSYNSCQMLENVCHKAIYVRCLPGSSNWSLNKADWFGILSVQKVRMRQTINDPISIYKSNLSRR